MQIVFSILFAIVSSVRDKECSDSSERVGNVMFLPRFFVSHLQSIFSLMITKSILKMMCPINRIYRWNLS